MNPVDVLIIGAGPTGLTLAIECMRYGLSCRIIDQAEGLSIYSKAIAIQARTLEIFQRIGIHELFLASGIQIKGANIHFSHKNCIYLNLQDIPSPFSYVLSLEQSKTEQILINYLRELGCAVEHSTCFISYEEKEGFIFAQTNKDVIQAKYLIGCDGSHSHVRHILGCAFQGKTFTDIFSLADVEIAWNRPHNELQTFLGTEEVMAAFPLPEKNRFRLVFRLNRFLNHKRYNNSREDGTVRSDEIALPTLLEIEQLLAFHTQENVSLSNPRWIANFHINSRLSNRYRKNNVFLAGDAAHVYSPVGGQGMNTGIQDAFNLAWKIAYTHQKVIKSSLLDTYEKERHNLGKLLLKGTERASIFITVHSRALRAILNYLLSFFISFKTVQKKILSALSEVNIRYLYKRAPNFIVLHEGKKYDFFTLAEKSKDFHLLLFNIEKPPIDHPFICVYQVVTHSPPKALLIRPDGYIAIEDYPPFEKLIAYMRSFNGESKVGSTSCRS